MEPHEVSAALCVDPAHGLTEEDVSARFRIFGHNRFRTTERLAKAKIIFDQFTSPLILILVLAGGVTLLTKEWVSAGVIFAAVCVNTILGFYQENKAETALAELQTYIRTRVRVRRGGRDQEIDSEELAIGDIIHISHGDRISADARIIAANNFETDESVLTGESIPEEKYTASNAPSVAVTDRTSMAYGGTLAVQGVAEAIVTAIGEQTEFGKIAALVRKSERRDTPLQESIRDFAARVGIVLGVLVVILFFVGLSVGYDVFDMFLISIAVAVSAVPEGLPIALTVILAIGVQRLAKKKGIVRRLLAAETLGATSLILTDKTGTLTEANMKLVDVLSLRGDEAVKKKEILESALSTLDVIVENPLDPAAEWRVIGHPIEEGLVKGAASYGVVYHEYIKKHDIIDRLPFSSEYKFSAVVASRDGSLSLTILGAPDILLKFTDLVQEEKQRLLDLINKKASEGYRVLGVASQALQSPDYRIPKERTFAALSFYGLLMFRDPLREHVKEAIQKMRDAGITTAIVTGDHRGTAEAVAREAGIIDGEGIVLTGDDMRHISREELINRLPDVRVFARVVPEDKLRLVRLFQERGETVAVTGDGVNDAPALKEADIGVALGSGTDVAKGAADLILLNDNFETMVFAIEEGRRILQNIRKVIMYLLSNSLAELFLIGGALVLGLSLPFNALQILFANFFLDSFPALAFAFEEGIDNHLIKISGSQKYSKLFDREMKFYILGIGTISSFALFAIYVFLLRSGFSEDLVKTFIFASFSSYTLFLTFAFRSLKKSIFQYNPFSNRYLTAGVCIGFLLTAAGVYLPFLQSILGTVSLPFAWVVGVCALGVLNILMIECGKWFFRRNAIQ